MLYSSFSKKRYLACVFIMVLCSQIVSAQDNSDKSKKSEISDKEVTMMVENTENLAGEYQLGLSLGKDGRNLKLKPGIPASIPLKLQSSGLNGDFDIYVLALMSEGNRIVVERVSKEIQKSKSLIRSLGLNMGSLNYSSLGTVSNKLGMPMLEIGYVDLKGLSLKLAGSVGSGAISTLAISPSNYPVNFTLPAETLGKLFEALYKDKVDEKSLSEFKINNEKFPVLINLAYLGSIAKDEKNVENIQITITPPQAPFFYDGIMLAPAVVKRFANEMTVLLYDDKRANRLIIPSEPPEGTERPKVSAVQERKKEPLEVNGELSISAKNKPELTIGRKSTVQFEVEYKKLKPSSEIYVVLQPANGNEIIQIEGNAKITSKAGSAIMRMCKAPTLAIGAMQIQEAGIIIEAPILLGKLEAGRLAAVEGGGNGRVTGSVTFTPPPFNIYYDRIRATPMALSWSDDGQLCTVFDNSNSRYAEVKIKGR